MIRCVECPCFFQSLNGVVIELHMDEFPGACPLEACSEVIEKLKQHLKLKVSPLMEPEVRCQHLRRHRVRAKEGAFIGSEWRHIDNVCTHWGWRPRTPCRLLRSRQGRTTATR